MRTIFAILFSLVTALACAPSLSDDNNQVIEAEATNLIGEARQTATLAAFSGTGYVEIPQNPKSGLGDIAIASNNSQNVTLRFWYATSPWVGATMGPDGPIETNFSLDIYIDGVLQNNIDLEAAGVWTVKDLPLRLRSGDNALSTMAATKNSGNVQIDRLSVIFAD